VTIDKCILNRTRAYFAPFVLSCRNPQSPTRHIDNKTFCQRRHACYGGPVLRHFVHIILSSCRLDAGSSLACLAACMDMNWEPGNPSFHHLPLVVRQPRKKDVEESVWSRVVCTSPRCAVSFNLVSKVVVVQEHLHARQNSGPRLLTLEWLLWPLFALFIMSHILF
jgi:hypothetical protein